MAPDRRARAARVLHVLLPVLLVGPARALDVQVEVGFDGIVVEGAWTPVHVRCTLGPDEPALDGRVVIARPREVVTSVQAPLRLQPGESATVRLAVPGAPGLAWEAEVRDARDRTLARAQPSGATALLLPDERLVLLVGAVGLPGLFEGGIDRPRVARLTPDRLPRDPHALDGAVAIVLKAPTTADAAHVELARDPAAVAALERYVRAGGTLLLVPGDAPFWRDAPLDALAPARVAGRAEEPASALAPALGDLDDERAVPVLACEPRPGARVTWSGRRHPLVIERALGRGRVVLVAFDPDREGLRGAARAGAFLTDLVDGGPTPPPALTGADATALLDELLAATPPLTSAWFYVLAAAAVAQLLAVSLLTAALVRRRGPWAALSVPPLASVALAAVLVAVGALARGDPRLTTLLLELPDPGGGAATVHAVVGLQAGRAGRYSVELPPSLRPGAQPETAFDLLRPRARKAALTLRPGQPATVGPIDARAHGRHALLLTGRALDGDAALRAGPAVSARAVPVLGLPGDPHAAVGPVSARVDVTSRAAAPLEGLHVLVLGPVGGRLGRLGPLQPEESATFSPGPHDLVAPDRRPLGPLDDPGAAAAVLERVARRLELAWSRAVAVAPNGTAPAVPSAWVLHAQVEPGARVRVLDEAGRPIDDARARTVRVTCTPAEGGW